MDKNIKWKLRHFMVRIQLLGYDWGYIGMIGREKKIEATF